MSKVDKLQRLRSVKDLSGAEIGDVDIECHADFPFPWRVVPVDGVVLVLSWDTVGRDSKAICGYGVRAELECVLNYDVHVFWVGSVGSPPCELERFVDINLADLFRWIGDLQRLHHKDGGEP